MVAARVNDKPARHFDFEWPLPRNKKKWAGASEDERATWADNMLIDHPELKAIVGDMCVNLAHVHRSRRSVAMLLLGESGTGKTTLIQELSRRLEAIYGRCDPELTVVPALAFEVPSTCTPNEVCITLLKKLGDPNPEERNRKTLLKATAQLINSCEVRVVLLDNMQDIPSKRGARGVEQVAVRLRDLIDHTHCLWIFLGTKRATEVVDNESQLVKRIPYRARMHYFTIGKKSDARRFRLLLNRLDEWLPLAESNAELLQKLSGKIFIASGGVLDRLVKLLDRCWVCAFQAGREHLLQQDLLNAHRQLHGPDIPNPFADDFKIRYLNEENEPFEYLHDGVKPKNTSKIVRSRGKSQREVA
jgi:hypothetical protein